MNQLAPWRVGPRPTCPLVQEAVSARLDRESAPLRAEAVATHLERCDSCRRFERAASSLSLRMRQCASGVGSRPARSRPASHRLDEAIAEALVPGPDGARPAWLLLGARARRRRLVLGRAARRAAFLIPIALALPPIAIAASAQVRVTPSHDARCAGLLAAGARRP